MPLWNTLRFIATHPLTRRRRLRALFRFVVWQIRGRLAPRAVAHEWIGGARLLARTGETGITGNIYVGLHEFEDMAFLLHFLRPDDLFVDVGANAGSYTVLAGAVVGARVIAFEPIPETYSRLQGNVRLNRLEGRVECHRKGVGARRQVRSFTSDRDTTNRVLGAGESSAGALEVEITTLDETLCGRCPSLIKIDVEGFEAAVIEGARNTVDNLDLRAIIVEGDGSEERYSPERNSEGTDLGSILAAAGFRPFSYSPFDRSLTPVNDAERTGNTLFLRGVDFASARVQGAKEVSVLGVKL